MFHADTARRFAVELENAAISQDVVDWALCRQCFALLEAEMKAVHPEMERFVSSGRVL